ncbi:RHS repeat-associated core domain-containing protein, partial [uncultured Chryseobacterium sp.]|uniref:RHS repeat-associated core domain-containing protein n=1 Tax=uncultured Chryseobacterium sp. TaxID=259322 RepID=UPI0025D88143
EYDLNGNITKLFRTSVLEYGSTTPTKIDDLEYIYDAQNKSNKLITLNDNSFNPTGYEGGGMEIKYDVNGNMTEMPDKTMTIRYNYLNLPSVVDMIIDFPFNVEYSYRADGVKLRKKSTSTVAGYNTITTTVKDADYLDGFQYNKTTSTTTGGGGGPTDPPAEFMAPQARAMERQAYSLDNFVPLDPTPVMLKNPDLEFFPTAEGFYDYKKDQYIYQYKDHLGNARVSFGRNSAGNLELVDVNDYYPFGMNHLKSGNAFFGAGSYKNYKYNGKELQETGMYDYGARMYMADIGRWGVVDPLAEKMTRHYQ